METVVLSSMLDTTVCAGVPLVRRRASATRRHTTGQGVHTHARTDDWHVPCARYLGELGNKLGCIAGWRLVLLHHQVNRWGAARAQQRQRLSVRFSQRDAVGCAEDGEDGLSTSVLLAKRAHNQDVDVRRVRPTGGQ